jgi:hypothetical protein
VRGVDAHRTHRRPRRLRPRFLPLGRADPAPEPRVTGRHTASAYEERVVKYN